MDYTLHCNGSITRFPWNRYRYGYGIRSDSRGWRYQSNDCGIRYEGGFDYNHLRYHRSPRTADILQLYPLKD